MCGVPHTVYHTHQIKRNFDLQDLLSIMSTRVSSTPLVLQRPACRGPIGHGLGRETLFFFRHNYQISSALVRVLRSWGLSCTLYNPFFYRPDQQRWTGHTKQQPLEAWSRRGCGPQQTFWTALLPWSSRAFNGPVGDQRSQSAGCRSPCAVWLRASSSGTRVVNHRADAKFPVWIGRFMRSSEGAT